MLVTREIKYRVKYQMEEVDYWSRHRTTLYNSLISMYVPGLEPINIPPPLVSFTLVFLATNTWDGIHTVLGPVLFWGGLDSGDISLNDWTAF